MAQSGRWDSSSISPLAQLMNLAKSASLTLLLALVVGCHSDTDSVVHDVNEARQLLMKFAVEQERFFISNQYYSCDPNNTELDRAEPEPEPGSYSLSVECHSNLAYYVAKATSNLSSAEKNRCSVLTLDARGEKTSAPNPNCWD